jgi:hypothetical protein
MSGKSPKTEEVDDQINLRVKKPYKNRVKDTARLLGCSQTALFKRALEMLVSTEVAQGKRRLARIWGLQEPVSKN